MIAYYRLPGVLAAGALVFYTLVVYAVFRLIGVTLTLAGVAAFILSIGMAVDANILIFERMKEEIRAGKTLGPAIEAGFNRAWSSILDSNVSTVLVAAWLYWQGTTIVRGFALVLIIGVLVSMFSAVTVTRTLLRYVVRTDWGRRLELYHVERWTDVRRRGQEALLLHLQCPADHPRPDLHPHRRAEAIARLHRRDRVGGPLREAADRGRAQAGARPAGPSRGDGPGPGWRLHAHPDRADRPAAATDRGATAIRLDPAGPFWRQGDRQTDGDAKAEPHAFTGCDRQRQSGAWRDRHRPRTGRSSRSSRRPWWRASDHPPAALRAASARSARSSARS